MATRGVYALFLKQKSYEIQKKARRRDSISLGAWVGDIGHYVVNTRSLESLKHEHSFVIAIFRISAVKQIEQMPPKKKFRSGRGKKSRFAGNRYTLKKKKRKTRLQLIKNRPTKPKDPIPKKTSGV